jgi:ParB family chromosome partitioning protein
MSTDTKPKRFALGKGLESLLPTRQPAPPEPVAIAAAAEPDGRPFEIAVDLIDRNPYQTRMNFDEAKLAELSASIASSGVVQPIVVRPGGAGSVGKADGRYTLITGERRVMASKLAGKSTIPAIVREVSNLQAMEMTIIENLQRADLNPMEQAHAYTRLSQDFQMTQEQMAIRTGANRTTISNFLRLLRLPESVQKLVETGDLSFGHARALLALENKEAMTAVTQKIVALNLSVRSTENYIQGIINPEPRVKDQKPAQPSDPNVREAEDTLRRTLGLKVTIEDKKGKGKVIIAYSGIEDFDAILTALGQHS